MALNWDSPPMQGLLQTLKGGSAPLPVRKAAGGDRGFVKYVQQLLASRGYQIAVDGVSGPQTEAALRDFEQKNGLQVTGMATPAALQALTAPPKPAGSPFQGQPGDVLNASATVPMPRPRPPPDVLNASVQPNTGMPPIPQMRDAGAVLSGLQRRTGRPVVA